MKKYMKNMVLIFALAGLSIGSLSAEATKGVQKSSHAKKTKLLWRIVGDVAEIGAGAMLLGVGQIVIGMKVVNNSGASKKLTTKENITQMALIGLPIALIAKGCLDLYKDVNKWNKNASLKTPNVIGL